MVTRTSSDGLVREGEDALARGAWNEARGIFERVLEHARTSTRSKA
jgi:hypothetical protein